MHETEDSDKYVPTSLDPAGEQGGLPTVDEVTKQPLNFRNKATPPPIPSKVKGTIGYVPKMLPTRWSPLELEKLEYFRQIAKSLFEDLAIMKINTNLVGSVMENGEIVEDTFYMLTEPRLAGIGLRYEKVPGDIEFHRGTV